MHSLKKIIGRYMQIITIIFVILIFIIITFVQILNSQRQAYESADRIFIQMEQVLEENQKELKEIVQEYSQSCLYNAEAIAYIIEEDPSVLESVEELRRIAEMMEVDEIHIFNEKGSIFTGTNPEYYGLTVDSGEQISYFKPMLSDKSLKLVQEITPNTAEEKMMQYSALWSSNRKFIVQVGMEPVSVMKVTEKNSLSYIFALLKVNPEANYYAIDTESGEIVGSTDLDSVGKNLEEIGFHFSDIRNKEMGFHTNIKGVNSFCVFKQIDNNYVGRVISDKLLYQQLPETIISFAVGLVLIAIILGSVVTKCMNHYVVERIYDINEKLRLITRGNLKETVNIRSSAEFSELSSYINGMVKSLLDNNKKMSYVLSKTNMYIGVYEYNKYMKKVRFTEYIPRIFSLNTNQAEELSADYKVFRAFIEKLQNNPVPDEKGVFRLDTEWEQYVKLEEIRENNEIFGVAIDVTDEVLRRRKMEAERDIDALTGLYNRRGLELQLARLFEEAHKLEYGALVMLDADGLKGINDTYGHEKGDVYLKGIAEVLSSFDSKNHIAGRMGGDEFVLVLYQYEEEESLFLAIHELERMQSITTIPLSEDIQVPLRFSLGYSLIGEDRDYRKLLQEADEKMYENKRERKAKQI